MQRWLAKSKIWLITRFFFHAPILSYPFTKYSQWCQINFTLYRWPTLPCLLVSHPSLSSSSSNFCWTWHHAHWTSKAQSASHSSPSGGILFSQRHSRGQVVISGQALRVSFHGEDGYEASRARILPQITLNWGLYSPELQLDGTFVSGWGLLICVWAFRCRHNSYRLAGWYCLVFLNVDEPGCQSIQNYCLNHSPNNCLCRGKISSKNSSQMAFNTVN